MPPRIRTRASKALKENKDISENKLKVKPSKIITKVPRKALADKTNSASASDDTSIEIPKLKQTVTNDSKASVKHNIENIENAPPELNSVKKQSAKAKQNNNHNKVSENNAVRPHRNRRLPSRFVENPVLITLSTSKEGNLTNCTPFSTKANNTPAKNDTLSKSDKDEPSPFKTPSKVDGSLLSNRPRRICRLPSRFEDHSISPNKYIPIQPANASTPIQQSKNKLVLTVKENVSQEIISNIANESKPQPTAWITKLVKIDTLQKESTDNSSDKSSPDSNNNAKGRSTRAKRNQSVTNKQLPAKKKASPVKKLKAAGKKTKSPILKTTSPKKIQTLISQYHTPINKSKSAKKLSPKQTNKKIIDKNLSFKVLGENKNSQESDKNNLDVYEFTFDPNEEPQPQKKKRKKTVKKNPNPKPKKGYKSTYDQNISKALAALKKAVKPAAPKLNQITEINDEMESHEQSNVPNVITVQNTVNKETTALNNTGKNSVHECNYPSIRVEDIAADIEPSVEHHDDINYSPINSPRQASMSPHVSVNVNKTPNRSVHNNDPLNLLEELSFFDEQPVASSSMNMSARNPLASPWRVEFGSLPIKWPVNAYVKPNMTPAVESSFISSEDSNRKKHVYTNIIPETNDILPEIVSNTSNLKQTSIIEFIKERAERSLKKKRGRSVSPTKAIFDEVVDGNADCNKKSSIESNVNQEVSTNTSEGISSTNDNSDDKENSKERRTKKRKNDGNICDRPTKSPKKDKNCTYFGFDDSENQNNENVSPIKINNPRGKSLRPRSKVLQEINGPIRAALPVAAKSKIATSSEAVNRVYEELKSGADAPLFPEKNVNDNETNVVDPSFNEDSQSVHLFEDIEVVHHLKPTRKSYGKAKKVTFQNSSDSDSVEGVVPNQNENDSSDYDDHADLTFEIPNVNEKKTKKKKKPKKLRSKKEEQEAEAWAANFNSMCEDIEEFPLLVE